LLREKMKGGPFVASFLRKQRSAGERSFAPVINLICRRIYEKGPQRYPVIYVCMLWRYRQYNDSVWIDFKAFAPE